MGQTAVKNPRRIFSQASNGGGSDPALDGRVTNLENNEYKVTYYEVISGASGSLTLPTGATINAGEFGLSGNCVLSKIDGSNKPTFESPKTAGGTIVTSSLNVSTGAWVASGTYTDSNVALIYSIKIKAIYYGNLTYNNIIETVELTDFPISQSITNGITNKAPSEDAVHDALALKRDIDKGLTVIYRDFTNTTPYTGTLSLTLINSAFIPANTIAVNDEIEIEARSERSSASGTGNNYLYINTINSLSGATLIGVFGNAGHRSNSILRTLWVNSSTDTNGFFASTSMGSSKGGSLANLFSSLNINWSNDVYIIQAYILSDVGHSAYSSGMLIKRIRM